MGPDTKKGDSFDEGGGVRPSFSSKTSNGSKIIGNPKNTARSSLEPVKRTVTSTDTGDTQDPGP